MIQLGGKYQILVDPVLAQVDGMTGALMRFIDFAELHAESPMAVQELPFAADSEGNTQKKNIVAISHDHYDHLNYNTLKGLPVNIELRIFKMGETLKIDDTSDEKDED